MVDKLKLNVTQSDITGRIDKFLATKITYLSRGRIQRLIETGSVLLNNVPVVKPKEPVRINDEIVIYIPEPVMSSIEAQAIELDIVYQDDDLVIINKPAGISVHPTETNPSGTLVNALLYQIKDLSGIGGELRPGIVHRLDKGTSGLLIVAKHDEAHRRLSDDFKERKVHKTYWALVHGQPGRREGTIDLPIGRHPTDRKRMTVRNDGRKSITMYKILRTGLGGSLLEVYPCTGRTHQIRVHLKHLGVPVVRDAVYGMKKYSGKGTMERMFESYPGVALHAKAIRFCHPVSGQELSFDVPPPEPFASIVEKMSCL